MDAAPAQLRFPFETPPAEGEALEVAEGVLWLRLPLPMKLDHVNCYALDDGDGWTIVTKDRSLSAQWEHTILVTPTGYEVLTLSAGSPPLPEFVRATTT